MTPITISDGIREVDVVEFEIQVTNLVPKWQQKVLIDTEDQGIYFPATIDDAEAAASQGGTVLIHESHFYVSITWLNLTYPELGYDLMAKRVRALWEARNTNG